MILMWARVCVNRGYLWALKVDDLENELHCCKQKKSHMSTPGVSNCAALFPSCLVKPSKSLGSHQLSSDIVWLHYSSKSISWKHFKIVLCHYISKVIPINCKYGRPGDSYNQNVSWSLLLMYIFSVCDFFFTLCIQFCYLYWQMVLVQSDKLY